MSARPLTVDDWGRVVCQVRGCDEPSVPWGITLDVDDAEVEVALCRRHEGVVAGVRPLDAA